MRSPGPAPRGRPPAPTVATCCYTAVTNGEQRTDPGTAFRVRAGLSTEEETYPVLHWRSACRHSCHVLLQRLASTSRMGRPSLTMLDAGASPLPMLGATLLCPRGAHGLASRLPAASLPEEFSQAWATGRMLELDAVVALTADLCATLPRPPRPG